MAAPLQDVAATVQERLHKRNQARIDGAERRKEAKESRIVSEEKSEYFLGTFQSEQAAIEELLSDCSGADRANVTMRLEEATTRTTQLQKFLNDSMLFLTQYELRKAQAALQKLQGSLVDSREEFLPKKKFAFKARTKASDKAAPPVEPAIPRPDAGSTVVDGAAVVPEQCGFSHKSDDSITMNADDIQKQDVLLTHLTNCKVHLFGSPSTLHLKHIDGCEILCGPVSSSVFIDHCRNSTLAFPCQQLRTHNTMDTQIYLHVTSRPIIEDCIRVAFAPFTWSYPTLEEDFTISGLERGRNNWNQVDDFNWLAPREPSPNWTVIPDEDRRNHWNT